MTPEERYTVIEALEVARTACTSSGELREINKALAIMRRNPPKTLENAWQAATAAERERAAKVCEEHPEGSSYQLRPRLAAAIRKG